MKLKLLIVLIVASTLHALGVERPRSFQTFRLDVLKPDPHSCDVKWRADVNQMIWSDDDHVFVWLIFFCDSPNTKDRKNPTELAVFDTAGHARSVWNDFAFGFLPGPSDTLIVGHGGEANLLDHELRTQETLKCPMENAACSIFIPPSRPSNSDFALCSYTSIEESCRFYQGLPSKLVLDRKLDTPPSNGIPTDPYKRESFQAAGSVAPDNRSAWKVSSSGRWYFDNRGRLTSQDSNGQMAPVSAEKWTPDYSNCTGDLSASEPFRFLATCVGAHIYTDGALDGLFGYSRIALFDVSSRQILARIDGPAYTSAILSPSGKLIAVEHEDRIRLYRVD
jgi:hypothetical protein